MNKRMKKKSNQDMRLDLLNIKLDSLEVGLVFAAHQIENLEKANSLKNEVIEKLGDDLAETKRQVAELEAIIERNAQATNNRFGVLEAKNKELRIDLDKAVLEFQKPKRTLFGRK